MLWGLLLSYLLLPSISGVKNDFDKVCWEECENLSVIQSVRMMGCYRRSTYPHLQDFWCKGKHGPPCFTKRGDTMHLEITWRDPGHHNLTQSVHWQSVVDFPWPGLDTEICKYVNEGDSCPAQRKRDVSTFKFPIHVQELYPPGVYDVIWRLYDNLPSGEVKTIVCMLIKFKIL